MEAAAKVAGRAKLSGAGAVQFAKATCAALLGGLATVLGNQVMVFQGVEPTNARMSLYETVSGTGTLVKQAAKDVGDKSVAFPRITKGMPPLAKRQQRLVALRKFREGAATVLVAPDIYSRGVDFRNCQAVVNLSIPMVFGSQDLDFVSFRHRCARTGRNGNKGVVFNVVTREEEASLVRLISQERFNYRTDEVELDLVIALKDAAKVGRYCDLATKEVPTEEEQAERAGIIMKWETRLIKGYGEVLKPFFKEKE